MSTDSPVDPKVVGNMEKTLAKETKADEREYSRALKELKRTEKAEADAFKATGKADKHLKKMVDKEYDTIRSLQKATHNHDQAMTNLHSAQSDVQIKNRNAQRLRHDVETLRAHTEEIFKAKETREEERGRKLGSLGLVKNK